MLFVLTSIAAIGSGLMAGVFFTFSNSVMKALARMPHQQGMAAMQAINRIILNPLFLGMFMGTAIVSLVLVLNVLFQWHPVEPLWTVTGGFFYIAGSFLVTIAFNVPLNNKLMDTDPNNPENIQFWNDFLTSWTAWNHVRTISSLGAAVSFILALS